MLVKKRKKAKKISDLSIPDSLERDDKRLIENITFYLKNKYKIDDEQLKELIIKKRTRITIPIVVFNKKIGALETVVKYLKENYKLRFKEISKLLNRSYTTISNSYKNSLKKYPKGLIVKDVKYTIPVSILKNRKFSVLEIIVSYLKDNFDLKFSQIANLLKRNVKTVWTVYRRYKRKEKNA